MQRCKAKSKRSGEQCKNYAMRNWAVCRMHGARGGPKTKDGKQICKLVPLTHGYYSIEQKGMRNAVKTLLATKKEMA